MLISSSIFLVLAEKVWQKCMKDFVPLISFPIIIIIIILNCAISDLKQLF